MFVKFNTEQEAEEYKVKLQSHHNATASQRTTKIEDHCFSTWDGKFALYLMDDSCPNVGSGEVVENMNRAVEDNLQGLQDSQPQEV